MATGIPNFSSCGEEIKNNQFSNLAKFTQSFRLTGMTDIIQRLRFTCVPLTYVLVHKVVVFRRLENYISFNGHPVEREVYKKEKSSK